MNKLGVVFGVAALAVVAGCKDPNYVNRNGKAQNDVKVVPAETVEVTPDVKPVEEAPADVTVEERTPAPAPVQAAPEPVQKEPVAAQPAPEPVYTTYIVPRGDYLAKISKKFNVKIDAIKAANPQLKGDVVRLGQKIKIPGRHDVGEQTVPEGALAKPAPKPAAPATYSGATEEYVVKSGDTLGSIAYPRGINIRQLKEMNALANDKIFVGQKLKVPAGKGAVKAEPKPAPEKKAAAKPAPAEAAPVAAPEPVVEPAADVAPATEGAVLTPAAPAPAPVATADATDGDSYQVQEGEDVLNLSIRFSLNPSEIRELNNMGPSDELQEGQIIKLPPGTLL